MMRQHANKNLVRPLVVVLVAGSLLAMVPLAGAQEAEADCFGSENVQATVMEDGILVAWDDLDNSVSFEVTRTAGGEEERFFVGSDTSYFDTEVEAGTTYTYEVEAFVDQAPSQPGGTTLVGPCGDATATAIPVFPTIVAGALATGLGVAGYAGARRR